MIKVSFKELQKLGATHCKTFSSSENKRFSRHYFNKDGLEVAYNIFDMQPLVGLTVLDNPREWSETLLNDKSYTELLPITRDFY